MLALAKVPKASSEKSFYTPSAVYDEMSHAQFMQKHERILGRVLRINESSDDIPSFNSQLVSGAT